MAFFMALDQTRHNCLPLVNVINGHMPIDPNEGRWDHGRELTDDTPYPSNMSSVVFDDGVAGGRGPKHFAVLLMRGVYLWKFGQTGALIASNIRAQLELFGLSHCRGIFSAQAQGVTYSNSTD